MLTTEMKKIEAELAIVKDSEKLLVNLRFSVSSRSLNRDPGFLGLDHYLKATKRNLRVQFVNFAIRALWHWICQKLEGRN